MTRAVLLNSVRDAEDFATNPGSVTGGQDVLLFSTHPSCEVYLRVKHNIACTCLSNFLSAQEVRDNIKQADTVANELAVHLDQKFSADLNHKLGLKGVRFFWALYSYVIYINYMSYVNVVQGLLKAWEATRFERLVAYDTKLVPFFDSSLGFIDLLQTLRDLPFMVTPVHAAPRADLSRFMTRMFRLGRALASPRRISKKLRQMARRSQQVLLDHFCSSAGPRVLLLHGLYDLEFLSHALRKKYRILNYSDGAKTSNVPWMIPPKESLDLGDWVVDLRTSIEDYGKDADQGLKAFVLRQVQEDFNNTIALYVTVLKRLAVEHESKPISLAIWGNSPVVGLKSIVNEYFLSQGVPVLGCQHGGMLGNLHNSDVYISDASRCTDYITYGFTREDLRSTYPHIQFNVRIHSLGTTKKGFRGITRGKFDILFAITNSQSMLEGSMLREKPDEITEKQIKILAFLRAIRNHTVMVKPFRGWDYDTLAVKPLLEKPGRITVMEDLSLMDALAEYEFKAIIIEHVSTPLYESLPYDMEIFVADDPIVRPIEETALEELKRRVYYREDVDSLIQDLTLFLEGKLPKKRDDTFYRHHVRRENAEQNIVKLVDRLVLDHRPLETE